MTRLGLAALVLCAASCAREATVTQFPTFTEQQNEWLQTSCSVAFVQTIAADTPRDAFKPIVKADVVERFAIVNGEVELVGYACKVPVPAEVSRGDTQP
jgi:hypothetical protein